MAVNDRPTILCITRAHPPIVGGMERLSFEFVNALARHTRVLLVANRSGKIALPAFLPWAAAQARRLAPHADVIHLGDPLLTMLLPFIGPIRPIGPRGHRRPPVAVTIHGLDIRYPNPFYQAFIRKFLPRVDLALPISRFVEREFHERFAAVPTVVMNPGIARSFALPHANRSDLKRTLGTPLGAGPLLLAVARLVPRKGIAWFVTDVLPSLPDVTLLVLGDGPDRPRIAAAAARAGVTDRLRLPGAAPYETLRLAYNTADLLVMPNIPLPGDAEGFGLVALEAASAGLPVVASNLEGIPDAVVEGETGVLVPPKDANAWLAVLRRLLVSPDERQRMTARAPDAVRERYAWETRARDIITTFAELAGG